MSADVIACLDSNSRGYAGRRLIDGTNCQYAGAVKPGDLVAANFDDRHVHTGGGLYLLEEVEDGRVVWSGCRRMMRVPGGIGIDITGHRDWETFPSMEATRWQVVGRVERVYRPTEGV